MTAFLLAAVLAAALTPAVIAGLRQWQLIDVPNHRSSHTAPVPRGGGIAVAVATVIGLLSGVTWDRTVAVLVTGSVLLAVTGLLDDLRDLSPASRLTVQVITPFAGALLLADRSGPGLVVAAVVAAVGSAGYVNAFNFMDGINGISGLQALVAGAFLALVARDIGLSSMQAAGWAVAGASIGFLPYNAVRARTFLGDVGSYFLGFWLAGIALVLIGAGVSPLVVIAPFLLYLADTSTVLVRRASRGAPLMEAHREHAYQRLTQGGWSHLAVAVLCAAVAGTCAAIMLLVLDSSVLVQFGAWFACVAIVALYAVLPEAIVRFRGGAELRP